MAIKHCKKPGPKGEPHSLVNIGQHYIDRFENRFDHKDNGCIFFKGNTQNSGYINWWYRYDTEEGSRIRFITAHRFAALISHKFTEQQVNEYCVLHDCDQYYENNDITYRQCVNPDHMFIGTVQDNIQDCIRKGRYVKPPQHIGEDNTNSKLTESQVLWVIEQHYKITQKKLATILNVNASTIEAIHGAKTWKHLPR